MTQEIGPFLKWGGSKQLIANAIRCQFPIRFSRYYEPFVGGGSVFLSLHRDSARLERIGDSNDWLMDTYRALRDSFDQVVRLLESLTPCKTVFDRVRQIHPSFLASEYKAAHLIYLNQLCFRNVFRLNKRGYFNVVYCTEAPDKVYNLDHLYQVHERLQGVDLYTSDFVELASQAQTGDFVYFDPPGKASSNFRFHESTKSSRLYGFKDNDYYRLSVLCRDLDLRGVLWAVSDTNTPLMRILFSHYNRTPLTLDPWDLEIKSLLFTNYITSDEHGKEEHKLSEAIS